MRRLGLERDIVDRGVRDRAADRCRSLGVTLPTFAQLAEPELIPADVRRRPMPPTRSTCSERTGSTMRSGPGVSTSPSTWCFPRS